MRPTYSNRIFPLAPCRAISGNHCRSPHANPHQKARPLPPSLSLSTPVAGETMAPIFIDWSEVLRDGGSSPPPPRHRLGPRGSVTSGGRSPGPAARSLTRPPPRVARGLRDSGGDPACREGSLVIVWLPLAAVETAFGWH
jgi:hypothetical protein